MEHFIYLRYFIYLYTFSKFSDISFYHEQLQDANEDIRAIVSSSNDMNYSM